MDLTFVLRGACVLSDAPNAKPGQVLLASVSPVWRSRSGTRRSERFRITHGVFFWIGGYRLIEAIVGVEWVPDLFVFPNPRLWCDSCRVSTCSTRTAGDEVRIDAIANLPGIRHGERIVVETPWS